MKEEKKVVEDQDIVTEEEVQAEEEARARRAKKQDKPEIRISKKGKILLGVGIGLTAAGVCYAYHKGKQDGANQEQARQAALADNSAGTVPQIESSTMPDGTTVVNF